MFKRSVTIYIVLCLLFSFVTFKIISLNNSSYADADNSSGTKTLKIGETRGTIYDRNMKKIVNSREKLISVAVPSAEAIAQIKEIVKDNKSAIESLSGGFPIMFESDKKIDTDDIQTFSVPERYEENQILSNVIGYLDSSGNGVSGIEKSFNDFLSSSSGSLSVTFSVDATGKALKGKIPTVNIDNFSSPAGVVLTIDRDIQIIAEEAMTGIESGACVILNVSDGSIAACVSNPSVKIKDIASSLKDDNSPFVNKAFTPYSVGSIFKPIVTAYAMEYGIDFPDDFECKGSINVDGTKYSCSGNVSHGKIGLEKALQVSCNSYFINLTKNTNYKDFCSFCLNFGFGNSSLLADGMYSQAGCFPEENELKNSGNLANLSFGQGRFSATPLQLASAYLSLINGGEYIYPTLVKGTVDGESNFSCVETKPSSKIISEETSDKLRSLMESVVTDGNAYLAQSDKCSVGGKTGTAQSGSFKENGDEILRTWFVGFFPVNEPRYVVAVLDEDGVSGGKDCAPVFSHIADGVMDLLIERLK